MKGVKELYNMMDNDKDLNGEILSGENDLDGVFGDEPVNTDALIEQEQSKDLQQETNAEVKQTQEDSEKNENQEDQEPKKEEAKGETTEKDESPASQDNQDQVHGLKAMGLEERRKRQEAEKKVAELQAELASLDNPEQKERQEEKQARPDVLEDPEGAFKYTEDVVDKKIFNARLEMSRDLMAEKHEDYYEMANVFLDMCKENPVYDEQARKSSNPAKYAYDTAKNYQESKKISDPNYSNSLKEKLKQEILAEMQQSKNSNSANNAAVKLPKLTNATSVGSNVESQLKDVDDTSLDDIFAAY